MTKPSKLDPPKQIDLTKVCASIKKTGFDLEYRVSEVLRSAGWIVINNKYYIDDTQKSVREIDLIAYKAVQLQDITACTALIVSCKKNEENAWALLSKDIDLKDLSAPK